MAKKEKFTIELEYLDLKKRIKAGSISLEEIDHITCSLIAKLVALTEKGVKIINETPIDLFKDRVWWIIEKAGLLPEYKDEDEEDILDDLVKDKWEESSDEFEVEIDDSKFYC